MYLARTQLETSFQSKKNHKQTFSPMLAAPVNNFGSHQLTMPKSFKQKTEIRSPGSAGQTHGMRSLPGVLVGGLWPGERFVIGLRVCSWLRRELRSNCTKVLLKSCNKNNVPFRPGMAARIQCDMTRHGRYAQSVQLVLSAADKIKNMYRYALRSGLEHSLSESLYQNLESLDLRGSAMGDLGVSGLASGLRKVRCLAFLDISSNAIGPNGAANLGRALGGCRTLRHLDLGENRLDPQSAQVMASALLTCPLQYLDMRSNNIGVEGARSIAQALQQSRTITHLNFARNWACAAGAESLATALSHSESLTYIDLSSNSLYENGVLALALLSTCPNLKHLNLAMNFFGDEGAGSLSRWIRKCTALEHLDLSSNGFLSTGAASLAEALAYCTAFSHLDVSGNRCQNEGAKCLMSELSSLPQLASMDFGRTGMHWGWGAELETILSSLARCSALAHLQLHGNNFSSGGTEQLAQGLRKCKRLRTLGMSNCALEDVGGAAIAELLGNGGSLESVDIQNNDIGVDLKHQMLKCHDGLRLRL